MRDPSQGALDGGYLFGDCVLGQPVADGPGRRRPREPVIVAGWAGTLSSIGEGEDGTVYATSLAAGELLRISAPRRLTAAAAGDVRRAGR